MTDAPQPTDARQPTNTAQPGNTAPPVNAAPLAAPEISWFSALCDDDYQFLGVADPALLSSWEHCRDIVSAADSNGFDNVLLPSGYDLGIDAVAFAAAIGVTTERIHLLLAVRMGELWLPQLARQLATIDQFCGGRLTINIISSDLPGQQLDSGPRYRRTLESMQVLRQLLNGSAVSFHGDFIDLELDPPRVRTVNGSCPPMYFGGFSEDAKETAASASDVFLTWPDTVEAVGETVRDLQTRAAGHERVGLRPLRCGLRAHVIVRETESDARAAATQLVSRLDDAAGTAIRNKSLDTTSAGVARQAELRADAGADGYVEDNLWTGVGRARSGAGAAIVGDPDQVVAKLEAYQRVGIDAFILSGYTHQAECDLVAAHVLPRIAHAPLKSQLAR